MPFFFFFAVESLDSEGKNQVKFAGEISEDISVEIFWRYRENF